MLASKSRLKGTNIVITEDLTKSRYDLYRKAVSKFGRKHVWCRDGVIHVNADGKRLKVQTLNDLGM